MDFRRTLDLNLIRVFIAIYETRSVTQAGERLSLTQPTVSYGLSKLRRELQDSLFVRTHEGMEPTAYAGWLYEEFTNGLACIDRVIDASRAFNPATSKRRFSVAMTDIGELIFLPPVMAALREQAPMVEVEVVQVTTEDLKRRLATGEVCAAVGNLPMLVGDTMTRDLFQERYVCVVRQDHPEIGSQIDLADFSKAQHVHVYSRYSGHGMVEDAVQAAGIERRIALRIPHFAILSHVIAHSDLLATIPSRVATVFQSYVGLRVLNSPIEIAPFHVRLHWHQQDDRNAAHSWFRNLLHGVLSKL